MHSFKTYLQSYSGRCISLKWALHGMRDALTPDEVGAMRKGGGGRLGKKMLACGANSLVERTGRRLITMDRS